MAQLTYGEFTLNIQEIPQTIELPVHVTDPVESERLMESVILSWDSGPRDGSSMRYMNITAIYE